MFTLQVHHNGEFTSTPGRRYLFGDTDWFDGVHCDVFSMGLLGEMLEDLGYTDRTLVFTHFKIHDESLDDGLLPLKSEEDVRRLVEYVHIFTQLELYIETGVSVVECEMMERMMSKGKGVVIEEIVDHDVNDNVGKDVDGETGNTEKLLLLSDEFQFRRLLEEIDQEFMVEDSSEDSLESTDVLDFDDAYYDDTSDGCTISGKEVDIHTRISDEEVDLGKDVDWTDDPYHLFDVPEPEEMHAIEEPQEPEEPQEISDMFAEIDQALDELDDVVEVGEGTEVYALFAEPISFSLVPLVVVGEERFAILDVDGDDGEQRVRDKDVVLDEQCAEVVGDGEQRDCDVAVIPDDQCAVVVGNERCMSVVEGDVIKDKVVAKQGDEPDEVLEKNGVGQDGVLAEDKFEDQGRSIKRRRLMADKKPKDDADKKPKDDAK
ncbi:transposase, MuDR [Artemisia annua]|uniref:Transposase, MuDR n=1 Tax=Artemisia annua TaxID=35608 RepID=A0A2U1LUX0_ARTAN|nr:transposase, MuDR [Artemisia annua]